MRPTACGRAAVLALLVALGCGTPPKPEAAGKTAQVRAAKPSPPSAPIGVAAGEPTEPPPPVADDGGTEPGVGAPDLAGPSNDPAAGPAARKDAVLALLRGGAAVSELPVVDADPSSTFDANLAARLQPREAPAFRLERGVPTVTGGLDQDVVTRIIRSRSTVLRSCYRAELKAKPTLSGRIGLTLQVSADGRVTKAEVSEDSVGAGADRGSGKNGIGKCFAKQAGRWRFPKSPDGTATKVVNTFRLGTF